MSTTQLLQTTTNHGTRDVLNCTLCFTKRIRITDHGFSDGSVVPQIGGGGMLTWLRNAARGQTVFPGVIPKTSRRRNVYTDTRYRVTLSGRGI